MSTGETHRDLGEIVGTTALGRVKPGVTFILPWRVDVTQDRLHKGIEECGCGFCPDDDGKEPI